jgi:hypothetical protein
MICVCLLLNYRDRESDHLIDMSQGGHTPINQSRAAKRGRISRATQHPRSEDQARAPAAVVKPNAVQQLG